MLYYNTHIHYSGFHANYGHHYVRIIYIYTPFSCFHGKYVNKHALPAQVARFARYISRRACLECEGRKVLYGTYVPCLHASRGFHGNYIHDCA
jgi:hypothetical protein